MAGVKYTMNISPEDYYNLFVQSDTGRRVLEDLKMAHHFKSSTFSVDPYQTALREGERNVILRILTILEGYEEEKKNAGT